jgi:hypothetical protein
MTTIDASAADWAAQTLAAAEAYAEEQAAEAAKQRAQAEAAPPPPPNDGVEPPPSSHQRALDAFHAHDPNRPDNTIAGSNSASGTPAAVPLSPQEVADMQAAGLTVTSAGNGTYLINAPVENINLTQAPPLEPSNNIVILPSPGGNTTNAPPPTNSAPPPPHEPTASTEVVKPPEKVNPKEPPKISTGMSDKADDILNKSPTLRKKWAEAKANDWKIVEGPPGSGSNANPRTKTISIDKSEVAPGPGYDARMAALLAHEIGHAVTPFGEPLPGKNRQDFVEKNVRQSLEHEGAAAFENARARDEILNSKPPGPDIEIRGGSDSDYLDTYDAYKAGKLTEAEAKSQMATTWSQEPQDRDKATGRLRTKEEQLADYYGSEWDRTQN